MRTIDGIPEYVSMHSLLTQPCSLAFVNYLNTEHATQVNKVNTFLSAVIFNFRLTHTYIINGSILGSLCFEYALFKQKQNKWFFQNTGIIVLYFVFASIYANFVKLTLAHLHATLFLYRWSRS